MLTRSRAKAANQPIFVDDQWSDAYIRTKDEQIDALHALQPHGSDWAFATDDESESDDDEDEDVWRSDDEANADSTDDEDEEGDEKDDENDAVDGVVSKSRLAGGALAENVFWTVMTLLFVPLFLYATVLKRYAACILQPTSHPWLLTHPYIYVCVCQYIVARLLSL
jgi:hypothetical protein